MALRVVSFTTKFPPAPKAGAPAAAQLETPHDDGAHHH
jgi:hypothetical protein